MSQIYAVGDNVIVEISKVQEPKSIIITNAFPSFIRGKIISVGQRASLDNERLKKNHIVYISKDSLVNHTVGGMHDSNILYETKDAWVVVINVSNIYAVED